MEISTDPKSESYGALLREVTTSAKQLIQSEVQLIKVEMKEIVSEAGSHLTQTVLFGALVLASVVPLLAAAVIALGDYWDGNYALSSLVIGLALAVIGGVFGYRALRNLLRLNVMPASTAALRDGADAVKRKSAQLTHAVAEG